VALAIYQKSAICCNLL